jgi:hypothetical protein
MRIRSRRGARNRCQRLYAQAVAHQRERAPPLVPDTECEHAAQPAGQRVDAPFLVAAQQHFRVAMRTEIDGRGCSRSWRSSMEVINAAVEYQADLAVVSRAWAGGRPRSNPESPAAGARERPRRISSPGRRFTSTAGSPPPNSDSQCETTRSSRGAERFAGASRNLLKLKHFPEKSDHRDAFYGL